MLALLPDKTEYIYFRLFKIILELKSELHPVSIMLDFQQSTINSEKKVFPQTALNG